MSLGLSICKMGITSRTLVCWWRYFSRRLGSVLGMHRVSKEDILTASREVTSIQGVEREYVGGVLGLMGF